MVNAGIWATLPPGSVALNMTEAKPPVRVRIVRDPGWQFGANREVVVEVGTHRFSVLRVKLLPTKEER